jgi:HEAT repeat protein
LTAVSDSEIILPPSQIEELLRTLVKAQRAFQMYLPNNPIYHRAMSNVQDAFTPVWAATDEIILTIDDTDFQWEDTLVYQQLTKSDSLAWALFKDGMRILILRSGCEKEEVTRFLQMINQAKLLPADAGDDLSTLLWEQDFEFIQYRFPDLLSEGGSLDGAVVGPPTGPADELHGEVQRDVAEGSPPDESRPKGMVDPEEFDSTLYFLDDTETRYLKEEIEKAYSSDLRSSCMAAVFDIFDLNPVEEVREEVLHVLESLFPNLLNAGEFLTCAAILRETRELAESTGDLSANHTERLQGFDERLSEPAIVDQLLQSLDEGGTAPDEEDVGVLLKQFRPEALETIVYWLPRLSSTSVRGILESVSERLATGNPQEVLRLLRTHESEALPGIIELCGRLQLEPSAAGLGSVLEHDDPVLRLAAVDALGKVGTPGAMSQVERALGDKERSVRMAAVKLVADRGYKNAQRRVEEVVLGRGIKNLDFGEKRAFFEAYGAVAGANGVKPMADMLLRRGLFRRGRNPEVRMCAALGLGRIGTPEAHDALKRVAKDRDRQVRNAVAAALKGIDG